MMQLIENIKGLLHDKLDKSGTAFYSSSKTLKKGKYLIVGLNPGGAEDSKYLTIGQSLISFLNENYNAYCDEIWKSNRLQKNLKALFSHLGEDLRFGKKPYDTLSKLLQSFQPETKSSGHGNWQILLSKSKLGDVDIKILGLPHLSRYVLYNKEDHLKWIKQKIA